MLLAVNIACMQLRKGVAKRFGLSIQQGLISGWDPSKPSSLTTVFVVTSQEAFGNIYSRNSKQQLHSPSLADMDFDEVTRTHESANNSWNRRLGKYNTAGIEKLASKYNNGITCDCVEAKSGSFNMCFKVLFDDKVAWAVRFPIPGKVMYPEEKIYREVAVMRFIKDKTRIPIPKVVAYGTALENHDPEMGPFIITDWVNGVSLESVMEEQP